MYQKKTRKRRRGQCNWSERGGGRRPQSWRVKGWGIVRVIFLFFFKQKGQGLINYNATLVQLPHSSISRLGTEGPWRLERLKGIGTPSMLEAWEKWKYSSDVIEWLRQQRSSHPLNYWLRESNRSVRNYRGHWVSGGYLTLNNLLTQLSR